MLHAESNTGRKFSTRYERSPELMRAVQTFQYWQLRFRQARRLSVSQPRLASLQLQAGLLEADISISSVDRILQCLQQAATSLRDYQKRHRELRAKYLEELAEAIVLDRSPDLEHSSMVHVKEDRVTNQIKQLLKRENMRRMFRKIKRVLKPVARMGLSKIEVPDPTARSTENGDPSNLKTWKGPWITATKPNDIAAVIKDINCTQYYQAHGTPFGSGPVAAAFGQGEIQLRLQNSFKVQSHLTSMICPCYRKLGASLTLWRPPIPSSPILMVVFLRMTSFLLTPFLKSLPPLLLPVGI